VQIQIPSPWSGAVIYKKEAHGAIDCEKRLPKVFLVEGEIKNIA
jgi:hypothetical protein